MNLTLGDTQYIIEEARKRGVLRNQLAYILSTAYHESAHTMKPVRETLATSDKQAIARLDSAWSKGQLKWVKTPYWRDGWFGRGYVQITHKANYDKMGVTKSEMLERGPATRVLIDGMLTGAFTGKKLSDYITLKKSDFVNARRIVNGTDKAALIAGYAKEYDAALKVAGYGVSSVVVEKVPVVADPGELEKKPSHSKTVWTWAGAAAMSGISGVGTFLGGLDWRVQLVFSAAIIGFAIYGIKRRNDLFKAVKDLKESVE